MSVGAAPNLSGAVIMVTKGCNTNSGHIQPLIGPPNSSDPNCYACCDGNGNGNGGNGGGGGGSCGDGTIFDTAGANNGNRVAAGFGSPPTAIFGCCDALDPVCTCCWTRNYRNYAPAASSGAAPMPAIPTAYTPMSLPTGIAGCGSSTLPPPPTGSITPAQVPGSTAPYSQAITVETGRPTVVLFNVPIKCAETGVTSPTTSGCDAVFYLPTNVTYHYSTPAGTYEGCPVTGGGGSPFSSGSGSGTPGTTINIIVTHM